MMVNGIDLDNHTDDELRIAFYSILNDDRYDVPSILVERLNASELLNVLLLRNVNDADDLESAFYDAYDN